MLDAGIAKVPDLSEREIWWKETLDAGGVPIGGHRWVELEGDIEFVGWAANETEAEFRAREVAWNRWKQAGQPDEGMPEDFRRFCESASSDG